MEHDLKDENTKVGEELKSTNFAPRYDIRTQLIDITV